VTESGHEIASAATFGRLVEYPVVDTETHVFVRCWPLATSPQMSAVDPFTRAEHSGELLVAEMDRVGVDLAVLIGYDGYDFVSFMRRYESAPADFMGGRAYTRGWANRYPDRLRYVTTLFDPSARPEAMDELDRELSLGAIGVKIFPAYLNLLPDAPEIRAALDLVRERSAAVAFGFEDTAPPATASLAEMYEAIGRLAADYPDVPIQLNHGANADLEGPEAPVLFEVVRANANILVSTSVLGGALMEWADGWRYPFPEYLRKLSVYAERVPPEQLAWATDWPWFEGVAKYPQLLGAIVEHATFFSDEDKRRYLGANAVRHWRLEVPVDAG
jgi:predicted TIM-barrel fold metal-dependent hydrolase